MIQNAKISSTSLGFEDHGIFTAFVHLDYGGAGQGFGGRALQGKWAYEFVSGVLKALEVETWEDLKGRPCRVDADHGKVYKIGHYLKDQWFDPTEWDHGNHTD